MDISNLNDNTNEQTLERYDRQIRLWGKHGQNRCSSSKVCLINANSLGTEILKSLCLAGIGSFTILDSHKLQPEDIGCNFIPRNQLGQNRGHAVKQMLHDLNSEVVGEVHLLETYLPHLNLDLDSSQEEPSQSFGDPKFWKQFNCVVACGFLYIDQINKLAKICWTLNVPLIFCKSIGFFGYMRVQLKEHVIIETHPDNTLPNFNLDRPFDELKEYLDSCDLSSDDNLEKINSFPYIVILYHYLKEWQRQNFHTSDRLPNCYEEKQELKQLLTEGLRNVTNRLKKLKQSQDDPLFENFNEANKAVNYCLIHSNNELPENVVTIFNNDKAQPNQNASIFWLIIRAIKDFASHKNNGRLPVSDVIPDMISSSEEYIKLAKIFSKKTKEDVDSVFNILELIINGMPSSHNLYEETRLICKNIRDLRVAKTKPLQEEIELMKTGRFMDEEEDNDLITTGLCLKATDVFYSTYGRLPGCQDDQVETDVGKLKDCVRQIIGKTANRLKTLDQTLYELCRSGGAELHATSAFMGGCVGQEVIKLITNQYIPIDDTLIYNSMTALTKVFKSDGIFQKQI